MFSRRTKKSLKKKCRDFFWPTIGWKKTVRYYKNRAFRLKDSPHSLALGLAIGIGISLTPFLGFHIILTAALCLLFRANVIAGLLGTLVGNPTTFPLIWLGTYVLGCYMTGFHPDLETFKTVFSKDIIHTHFYEIFMPMTTAGIVCGVALGVITYYPLKKGIETFQKSREERKRDAATRRAALLSASGDKK